MNRRQRRAAGANNIAASAHESSGSASDYQGSNMPMARPSSASMTDDTSGLRTRTLYQIAGERQAELTLHGQPFPKQAPQRADHENNLKSTKLKALKADGRIADGRDRASESAPTVPEAPPLHALFDTVVFAITLSSLHFTLSFLTLHQYAQQNLISLPGLLKQTLLTAFPILTLLIHLMHGHALPSAISNATAITPASRVVLRMMRQILFVLTANVAGCYLIYLTNDRGYYAVMKRAPAIGTLWVWSVIELGLIGALAGVIGPGLFAWWNRYDVW